MWTERFQSKGQVLAASCQTNNTRMNRNVGLAYGLAKKRHREAPKTFVDRNVGLAYAGHRPAAAQWPGRPERPPEPSHQSRQSKLGRLKHTFVNRSVGLAYAGHRPVASKARETP